MTYDPKVSRRTALGVGGSMLAASAFVSTLAARAEGDASHAGHDSHGAGHDSHGAGHDSHGAGHEHHAQVSSQHQALIDAALHCVARAEACVPHCLSLLGKGDTSLAECLESVLEMAPVCTAAARLAALDAAHLKGLVKVCLDVCADCEKVCRKHAEHHEVCKKCADSCAAFIKEGKKLTDA